MTDRRQPNCKTRPLWSVLFAWMALAVGLGLATSAPAQDQTLQTGFDRVFDLCTRTPIALADRIAILEAEGWYRARGSYVEKVLAVAYLGASAGGADNLAGAVRGAAWLLEDALLDYPDAETVAVFQPVQGVEPDLVVVLDERDPSEREDPLRHLQTGCIIAVSAPIEIPTLFASLEPSTRASRPMANITTYYQTFYSPPETFARTDGSDMSLTPIFDLRLTHAMTDADLGPVVIRPFALVTTEMVLEDDDWMAHLRDAMIPDPRDTQ